VPPAAGAAPAGRHGDQAGGGERQAGQQVHLHDASQVGPPQRTPRRHRRATVTPQQLQQLQQNQQLQLTLLVLVQHPTVMPAGRFLNQSSS